MWRLRQNRQCSGRCNNVDSNYKQTATKTTNEIVNKNFRLAKETRQSIKERRNLSSKIKINKNVMDVTTLKSEFNNLTREMKERIKRDKRIHFENKSEQIKTTKDGGKKWRLFNELMENNRKDNQATTQLKTPDGSWRACTTPGGNAPTADSKTRRCCCLCGLIMVRQWKLDAAEATTTHCWNRRWSDWQYLQLRPFPVWKHKLRLEKTEFATLRYVISRSVK